MASAASAGGAASGPGAVLNASGYVTARRRATVSSKVTGKVVEILSKKGSAVKPGQVLARLDDCAGPRGPRACGGAARGVAQGLAEDQARLREAELNLERRERLLKDGVVGRAEVDNAQAEVESLKARIAYTQQQVAVAEAQVNLRRPTSPT